MNKEDLEFNMLNKYKGFILPLIFATVYILFSTLFLSNIGHRWNGINADPDYIHLFETLNVINGYSPCNIDNPATTLHFLSAFLFRIIYLFRTLSDSPPNITHDVLINPDLYLTICSLFFIVIIGICIVWFARTVLKHQNNLDGILILGSLFLMTPLFTNASEFSAQPQLIIFGLVLLNIVYKFCFIKNPITNLDIFLIGSLLAFGLFTKFTMLHLFPLVLFLGLSKHQYGLALGSFIVICIPFTLRLYGEEQRIFQWLYGNLTRTGNYGSRPEFWPDLNLYFVNLFFFLRKNFLFCSILLFAILQFCFNPKLIRSYRLVFTLVLLQFIFIAFMAKHRTSSYYFIIDFIFLPVYVKFLLDEYRSKATFYKTTPWIKFGFIGAIILFFFTLVYFRTNRFKQNISYSVHLFKEIERHGILNGTGSGSIEAASFYGNWNSGFKYSNDLIKIFGNQNIPDINSDSMIQYDGRKVRSLLYGEQILIHDYDLNQNNRVNYDVTKRFKNYLLITKK